VKKSFIHTPKNGAGFTLIELLVVISIIGLLSSIVLVGTKGAREKAGVAKVLQFSASVHHTLGAYMVGEWKFEEGENGTCQPSGDVCDTSGNGNNGTWHGTGDYWKPNDDISQLGTAGEFNGVDDYIEVPPVADQTGYDISFDMTDEITIELWMKATNSLSALQFLIHKPSRFWIVINEGSLFFVLDGVDSLSSSDINLNEWHHIVGTYDKNKTQDNNMKLYIDANRVDSKNNTDEIDVGIEYFPLTIGSAAFASNFFNGLLDNIRIYDEALTSAQIRKLYVEGAKKRGLLVEK